MVGQLRHLVSVFTFALGFYSADAQELVDMFANYQKNFEAQKIFVHTDKEWYAQGETIWFKAYQVSGKTHIPNARSGKLYVSLIAPGGKCVIDKILDSSTGFAAGDIDLPDLMLSGEYRLVAYTDWMLDTSDKFLFEKRLKILGENAGQEDALLDDVIDMQFFPEGGQLIEDLVNYVAFKIMRADGTGINLNGFIQDQQGNTLVEFTSLKMGMGKFPLIPKTDQTYQAVVSYNGKSYTFLLPSAKSTGHVMQLKHRPEQIDILITNNASQTTEALSLIGHLRGTVFCVVRGSPDQAFLSLSIPTHQLPPGIAHFTLFDSNDPVAERLAFIDQAEAFVAPYITLNKHQFSQRDSVSLSLSLSEMITETSPVNVSVSIFSKEGLQGGRSTDIRTFLWLESDIKGTIEQPSYYFDKNNQDRLQVMDLLLMTHGWRRFKWEDILHPADSMVAPRHRAGFQISGQLVNPANKKRPVGGVVSLSNLDNLGSMPSVPTDTEGRFLFDNLKFYDSARIVLQANRLTKKKQLKTSESESIAILIDALNPFRQIPEKYTKPLDVSTKIGETAMSLPESANWEAKYLDQWKKILTVDSTYDPMKSILLDEIHVVTTKTKERDPFYRGALHGQPTDRLVMDSIKAVLSGQTIFSIVAGRIPGVRVEGTPPRQTMVIRGPGSVLGLAANSPLFILDGVYVSGESINAVSILDVSHIEVIKGPDAAIYGASGANGVLAVYTRNGIRVAQSRKNIAALMMRGFDMPREFYAPRYGNKVQDTIKPDYRTTLYWNQELIFDPRESTTVSFYTSDDTTNYVIIINGITYDGLPIYGTGELVVK